ncbi:MAG TPA: type II toxin-antitoxin system HicA family toxin [Candidatus Aphodousia gallistercoris]|nr:type II toxin-antitoxin system HicA family toxin [Candidatus Aphodousia gallistercoris]
MTSQEVVIDALKENGWVLDRIRGSHHIFTNSTKSAHVTVPHPRKDMAIATLKSIERQCGFKLKR